MLRDVSFSIVYFPLFATLNNLGPRKADGSGKLEVSFYEGTIYRIFFQGRPYFGVPSYQAVLLVHLLLWQ